MTTPAARLDPATLHLQLKQRILSGRWRMGDKLPTTKELAAELHCSVGAVSKAIALLAHAGWVEQRKRAGTRVIRGLDENDSARASLEAFAFIYPTNEHEGISRTVKGFQDAARAQQRRLVMLTTSEDFHRETEYIGRLAEFDVRGAVIYPILQTPESRAQFIQMLATTRFPVIIRGMNLPGLNCPSVTLDGFHAGYTMTRHLLDQGATRIGFFSNYAWVSSMRDRHRGYLWALEERGLVPKKEWVLMEESMHADYRDPLREPAELARQYLQGAPGLEAVVCSDDYYALACLRVARELGRRVPDDLRITGMGDYDTALAHELPLTTYHIPYEAMGRQSFDLLHTLVYGGGKVPAETQVRGHLVTRQSG